MALDPRLATLTILDTATTSEILNLSDGGFPRAFMAGVTGPTTLTETINIETSPNEAFTAGTTGILQSGGLDVALAAGKTTPLSPIVSRFVRLKATVALAAGNRVFQWQGQPSMERLSK